jgi:uncharacterized protein YcbX
MTPGGSPRLARITIFPVKSFDGLDLDEVLVRGGGGLEHDREYRLADSLGALNGKRLGEKLIRLRSSFDLAFGEITISDGGEPLTARLPREAPLLEGWLSERLGVRPKLERNEERGFPDDTDASGPTVISRATLAEVATWFDGVDEAEARRRFRANLEIDGVPAFWEDCLYGAPDEVKPFQIGDVAFHGVNPCARCAVPSRDSRRGDLPEPHFAKILAEKRRASLPAWADASRFDHYYRLAVNTRLPSSENGKTLHRGDEVRLL